MEEVIHADRVIVMDDGRVVMDGTPREVFSRVEGTETIQPGRAPGDGAGL